MAKKNNEHHVVPHKDGWAIKKSGSNKASKVTSTKKEAENIARKISQNQGTELDIHGKNGKIQRKDSHGNDPNPSKDKN